MADRSARKLISEIGGAPALDLIADYERIIGPLQNVEIVHSKDGRVVQVSHGSATLYPSSDEFCQLLAFIEERGERSTDIRAVPSFEMERASSMPSHRAFRNFHRSCGFNQKPSTEALMA